MEAMHRSTTYNMLAEPKASGDLGSPLTEEKELLESLKQILEEHFLPVKISL
jgi:hypothetical protein